jgi:hypothetical protein
VNYSMVGASAYPVPGDEPSPVWGIPGQRQGQRSSAVEYVHFAELFDANAEPDVSRRQRSHGHHCPQQQALPDGARPRTWICLAEWVLGGWARTLRAAVLVLVAALVIGAVVTVLVGFYGVAAGAVVLVVLRVLTQRGRRPTAG